jgi:AsmA protein
MKSVLKIVAWLIGIIFVLIVMAAIILPLMVDPNDFRDDISAAVKNQTGRELSIEGDLKLSVIPWLGVEVGRVSLSNAPGMGDEPMVAIEGASVGVKLIPLLSRRLEVSQITLDGARINLYRGPGGTNWDLTGGAESREAAPEAAGSGFGMTEVGGIRLKDARVRFVDDTEGARLEAALGEFETGRITAAGDAYAIDGALISDASVDYEDKETGKVEATLGALVVDEITADPEAPELGGLRVQKASAQLSGGKSGRFSGSVETLNIGRLTDLKTTPKVEGLQIEQADVDYDDAKGTAVKAKLKILSAARIVGDADKPVLESLAMESATFDYNGGKAGGAKGAVGKFSVDRLVGDADAPVLDQLLLEAADVDYDDGAGGRYGLKAEKVDAVGLQAGPGALVLGRTQARQVRVTSAGEDIFELDLAELDTGGVVADANALKVDGLTLKTVRLAMDGGETGPIEARIADLSLGVLEPGTATPLKGKIEGSYGKPEVDFVTALDGQVGIKKDGTIELSAFKADLDLKGDSVPGGRQTGQFAIGRFAVNTKSQVMALDGLTANLADMSLQASATGQKIVDAPDIQGTLDTGEFSPRRIFETLGLPAPVTTDSEAMTRASLVGSFRMSEKRVALSGLKARLDDTTLNGDFSAVDGEPAVVRATLKVDQIDLDRYLPPEGETAAASDEGTGEIDTSDLKKLDAVASLDIGRLKVSGITLTNVKTKAVVKDGRLVVEPLAAALYGGTVNGRFSLDGTGEVPRMQFNQALVGVETGSLLADLADNDRLTGRARFDLNLDTAGRTSDEMIGGLDGNMNFELTDGVIRGVNITNSLQSAMALLDGKAPPKPTSPDTVFQDFRGTAKVEQGVIKSDDLKATLPNLNVTGAGSVNLATQSLDYRLNATVPKGQAAIDAGLGKLAGKSVPVKITGKLSDPDVSADVSAIVASQVEGLILDKLGIGKKTEEPAPAEATGEPAGEQPAEPPPEEQQKTPQDELEDAAKKLKKIFGG